MIEEFKTVTLFKIDIKEEHLQDYFLRWVQEYLSEENCEIHEFKFYLQTYEYEGLYMHPNNKGEIALSFQWINPDKYFHPFHEMHCLVNFKDNTIRQSTFFSTISANPTFEDFFNKDVIDIIKQELQKVKEKADIDFPELKKRLQPNS